jgi:hypothetical protein
MTRAAINKLSRPKLENEICKRFGVTGAPADIRQAISLAETLASGSLELDVRHYLTVSHCPPTWAATFALDMTGWALEWDDPSLAYSYPDVAHAKDLATAICRAALLTTIKTA